MRPPPLLTMGAIPLSGQTAAQQAAVVDSAIASLNALAAMTPAASLQQLQAAAAPLETVRQELAQNAQSAATASELQAVISSLDSMTASFQSVGDQAQAQTIQSTSSSLRTVYNWIVAQLSSAGGGAPISTPTFHPGTPITSSAPAGSAVPASNGVVGAAVGGVLGITAIAIGAKMAHKNVSLLEGFFGAAVGAGIGALIGAKVST